jgi:hypothetical protein
MTCFFYDYDKTKHNINHNYFKLNSVISQSSVFGLDSTKYPTIEELKTANPKIYFPDDFNYFSFLGNTWDTISMDDIIDAFEESEDRIVSSIGNIGSKLPEELKCFKNTINDSNILEIIAYPYTGYGSVTTGQNGQITGISLTYRSPLHMIDDNVGFCFDYFRKLLPKNYGSPASAAHSFATSPIVTLHSIGHSDKMNGNPFIWFISSGNGFVGLKENGEIFTRGTRTNEMDHLAVQTHWNGIFPHTLIDSDAGLTSFAFKAKNTNWYTEKLKTHQIGNYWPPTP